MIGFSTNLRMHWCTGALSPASWHHAVLLMFLNRHTTADNGSSTVCAGIQLSTMSFTTDGLGNLRKMCHLWFTIPNAFSTSCLPLLIL